DARDCRQVADAQLFLGEGAEDAVAGGVREDLKALGGGLDLLWTGQGGLDTLDGVGVHEAHFALAACVDGGRPAGGQGHADSPWFGWKRSRRTALAVTTTVAPVSERMAGHRPVMPRRVVTRKTALSPRANVDRKSTRLNSSHVKNSY